ncbi:MAG: Crp/Fnr family transcriptional regulator [Oculatellaceae cyanobacterium Prado106]|nr:Crp/Fnr family transcriptional regulator [Oculatellaceae cyanobacterium Prado106]
MSIFTFEPPSVKSSFAFDSPNLTRRSPLDRSSSDSLAESRRERPLEVKKYHFRRREYVLLDKGIFWQIESGVVRSLTHDETGKLIPLGFWGTGDIVGQPSAEVGAYQIECLTNVIAYALPEGYRYPQDMAFSQVRQMEELLVIMHSGSIEKRLIQFLIWMAKKFGSRTTQGWLIDLRLTHQDIADVIGTSRVTTTRILNKMQQDGIIHWSRKRNILLSNSFAVA